MESNQSIKELLIKVKSNKKYKTINDNVVLEEINKYIKRNPNEKINKLTIKEIRKNLHRMYSSYQLKNKKKKFQYLEELKNAIEQNKNQDMIEITNKLLFLTISTKERLNDYPNLYQQIFNLTGFPKTIIDLGSGLNSLSFPYMNLNNLNYYAYDIDEDDIDFLNQYFKIMKQKGLNGKAEILDVKNTININNLPISDIVFIFKLIDLIKEKKKNITEELIRKLTEKTKFIVISFATKTLSGKPMNLPFRKGFELMLSRLKLDYKTIKIKNEIFYVIKTIN